MQLTECMPLSEYYAGGFQETAPGKTAKNTVKHQGGGVGLVVANCRGNSVTVATLLKVWLGILCGFWKFKTLSGGERSLKIR